MLLDIKIAISTVQKRLSTKKTKQNKKILKQMKIESKTKNQWKTD